MSFHNVIPVKDSGEIDKTEMPENISLCNVKIFDLKAKVEERLLFGNNKGEVYHIGAGIKIK